MVLTIVYIVVHNSYIDFREKYEMFEERLSLYEVRSTLIVMRFTAEDSGSYTCFSSNAFGKAEGTIRVYGKSFSSLCLYLFFRDKV